MRTIDNQTIYQTQDKIAATIVDGILDGNLIASLIFSNGKPWNYGEKFKKNLKYKKSRALGWYTGMGDFNTAQQKVLTQMEWTPSSMYASVTLPYFDLSVNKSLPVIQMETSAMLSAQQDMIDSIGTAFYGSGANSQCDGLGNIVDDGTVAATYAGLTRATYPTPLNSDVDTSVGSISLNTISQSIDEATVGSEEPDIIITTQTLWRALEDLLFPSIQATYGAAGSRKTKINRLGEVTAGETLSGLAGYTAIHYRGIPIVKDEKCTSGYSIIKKAYRYAHYKFSLIMGNLRCFFNTMAILWKQPMLAY